MIRELVHVTRVAWQHEYAKGDPVRALARFVRLQLASRIINQPILVPFAGTTWLVVRHGARGANANYYLGLLEFRDMAFCMHYLRPSDLFADVGANIGSYSVLASGVAGAQSIAFEPVPSTAIDFRRNILINGIGGLVELRPSAVSDFEGTALFSTNCDTTNKIVKTDRSASTVEVPVTTLDRSLPSAPKLLKIDTEGYDIECLRGAKGLIESQAASAMLVEFGPSETGASVADTLAWLDTQGFAVFDYDPRKRELAPATFERHRTHNVLLVRDIEHARERVASAPRIKIATSGSI
jgi:FkbM family methyltransferase